MLDALSRLSSGRPRAVLAGAAVIAVVALAVGVSAIDRLHPYSAADPESDSSRATQLIYDQIGIDPDAGIVALVELPAPFRSPASQERVDDVAKRIFLERGVGFVSSYYTTQDRSMVSRDGTQAFVVGVLRDALGPQAAARRRAAARAFADDQGVRFGGEAPGQRRRQGDRRLGHRPRRADRLPAPVPASRFWFFRGLVAALLPLAIGALAIAASIAGLRLANEALRHLDLRAQPGARALARPLGRLRPAARLALPRGARPRPGGPARRSEPR